MANYLRLHRLALLLERTAAMVGAPRLDMQDFATVLVEHEANPLEPDCGTVCCALGLAALSGEFKQDGLDWYAVRAVTADRLSGYGNVKVVYDHERRYVVGLEAGEWLFDLTAAQVHYFFLPGQYAHSPTMLQVANRIHHFIAARGAVDVRNGHTEELT